MKVNKIVRVSRLVSRISVRQNLGGSFPKTVQRGTVKYLPFMFESIQSGSVDLKSFENATAEVIMCDVITVGLNIALVLWNNEIKNMSDKKLNDNDT
jgi:hypothetical protein